MFHILAMIMHAASQFVHTASTQFVDAFSIHNLPATLITVGLLVFLEVSLSGDNALVLAEMASHLPKNDPKHGDMRKKALYYGMWGAFVMRGASLIFAGILLNYLGIIKIVGGIYLLTLMMKSLSGGDEAQQIEARGLGFWPTVGKIEIMDMQFSVDNIAACVAISPNIGLVLLGVFMGIVAMRFVSRQFLSLLEKFPTLGKVAYLLIGIVAVEMLASLVGFELSEITKLGIVVAMILGGIGYDKFVSDATKERLANGVFSRIGSVMGVLGDFSDKYIIGTIVTVLGWVLTPVTFPVKLVFRGFMRTNVGKNLKAKFTVESTPEQPASPAGPQQ